MGEGVEIKLAVRAVVVVGRRAPGRPAVVLDKGSGSSIDDIASRLSDLVRCLLALTAPLPRNSMNSSVLPLLIFGVKPAVASTCSTELATSGMTCNMVARDSCMTASEMSSAQIGIKRSQKGVGSSTLILRLLCPVPLKLQERETGYQVSLNLFENPCQHVAETQVSE